MDDLLTLADAAMLLGVSRARAHELYRAGRLPGRKLSANALVFRRPDVEAFAAIDRKPGRPSSQTGEGGLQH